MLGKVAHPVMEVGPAWTGLPSVTEDPPGQGPLVAVATGWDALWSGGWRGPVLVVATDLPRLDTAFLSWLAEHPAPGSVVPVRLGRVQPLCARYAPQDLDQARRLVAAGRRKMSDLVEAIDPLLAPESGWPGGLDGRCVLDDADTPADFDRLGLDP